MSDEKRDIWVVKHIEPIHNVLGRTEDSVQVRLQAALNELANAGYQIHTIAFQPERGAFYLCAFDPIWLGQMQAKIMQMNVAKAAEQAMAQAAAAGQVPLPGMVDPPK